MGADSTIVNAAFKEAISKAGAAVPDMSGVIKGQVEISKTYLGGITDVFANMKKNREEIETAQNAQLQAFKVQAKKAAQHILKYEQSQPMKIHDAIYDKFKALEKEFALYNTTGDDDNATNEKMRAELYAQLSMISNQAVKSRGTIAEKAVVANDIVSGDYLSVQDLAVGRAIMGVDGNYENIELSFDETGQLLYHVLLDGMTEPVKWTIDEFNEKIVIHDRNNDVYTQKGANEWNKAGREGKIFTADNVALTKDNYLHDIVKTERDFKDAAYSKMNGKKSWVSSLYDINEDTINIATKAIEHLFTEDMLGKISLADVDEKDGITMFDVDTDKSGTITKDDMKDLSPEALAHWEANIESIINALTKPQINGEVNPAFNLDRSKSLLGDYYMKGLVVEYQKGFNNQPESDETTVNATDQESISKRDAINTLVNQDIITLNDIDKVKLRSGFEIVQERGNYVIYQYTTQKQSKVKEFSINDREALRTALYNYGGVLNKHRTFEGISEFEEQIDTTPDYLFQLEKGKGGEQESR